MARDRRVRESRDESNFAAAKLGQVCYEHAHCRLWDPESHCDFLIPDLFGRCQCTAPMRREGDVCRPDSLVRPAPLPEHLPSYQAPSEEVTEPVKETVGGGQKTEGEQDTGTCMTAELDHSVTHGNFVSRPPLSSSILRAQSPRASSAAILLVAGKSDEKGCASRDRFNSNRVANVFARLTRLLNRRAISAGRSLINFENSSAKIAPVFSSKSDRP